MTSIHPTSRGLTIDTSYWDTVKGTLPLTVDMRLSGDDMRALARELNRRAGPPPEPPVRVRAPRTPVDDFRRDVPTREGGWVIVTSSKQGVRLDLDVGTTGHPLTPAQAFALADALTTAARHQTLTIPRKDPS